MAKETSTEIIRVFLNPKIAERIRLLSEITGLKRTNLIKLVITELITGVIELPEIINPIELVENYSSMSVTAMQHLNVRVTPTQKDQLVAISQQKNQNVSNLIVSSLNDLFECFKAKLVKI